MENLCWDGREVPPGKGETGCSEEEVPHRSRKVVALFDILIDGMERGDGNEDERRFIWC